MDLLARLLGADLHAGTPSPIDDFWYGPMGTVTPAGVRVDAEGAKKISAWFRGRDILATSLAMLPFKVFERLPNDQGATVAKSQPLYDLIHDQPNPYQDSFTWRRQAMYHLIDYGNAYSLVLPGARGFADQLRPIHPRFVKPEQLASGRVLYHVRDDRTLPTTYTQDDIFHLVTHNDDGVVGKGILAYARASVGTAMATEQYAARVFSAGTLSGGYLKVPGKLGPEASKRMASSFVTAKDNWHLPKVLEQGAEFQESKLTPEDAQMLLSRKFTIDDMARWLGVPRMMLENSDPSFGNAEQFNQNFVTYSLGPWLSLWEFATNRQLILNRSRFYAEFERDALVRGDIATRWEAHVKSYTSGLKTKNEIRRSENLNAVPDGDAFLDPAFLTGKTPAPAPARPAPPARQRSSEQADDDGRLLQAEKIATASAARLLRKEIAAVQKSAVRHATSADEFLAAVAAFYEGHAALVADTMQVPIEQASLYCAGQYDQVAEDWAGALARWQSVNYAAGLAALALEGVAA